MLSLHDVGLDCVIERGECGAQGGRRLRGKGLTPEQVAFLCERADGNPRPIGKTTRVEKCGRD